MPNHNFTVKDIERFWSKVDRSDPGECWIWRGRLTPRGYGDFRICHDGVAKTLRANRVAWEMEFGEIPGGMVICHTCDTPSCCNPSHFFIGTHAENQADKTRKGRQARGSGHGTSRLSEEQVLWIRNRIGRGEKIRPLAREFGVSQRTVQRIHRGMTWRHILPTSITQGEISGV